MWPQLHNRHDRLIQVSWTVIIGNFGKCASGRIIINFYFLGLCCFGNIEIKSYHLHYEGSKVEQLERWTCERE